MSIGSSAVFIDGKKTPKDFSLVTCELSWITHSWALLKCNLTLLVGPTVLLHDLDILLFQKPIQTWLHFNWIGACAGMSQILYHIILVVWLNHFCCISYSGYNHEIPCTCVNVCPRGQDSLPAVPHVAHCTGNDRMPSWRPCLPPCPLSLPSSLLPFISYITASRDELNGLEQPRPSARNPSCFIKVNYSISAM